MTLVSYALMHMREVPVSENSTADLYLLELAVFSGIALVAAEGLRTREDVLAVLRTLVSAVAVMSAIAILQFRPGFDLTVYIAKIPGLALNGAVSGVQQRRLQPTERHCVAPDRVRRDYRHRGGVRDPPPGL